MEKVYKNLLYYAKEDAINAYTHVALTKEEYQDLLDKVALYKQQLDYNKEESRDIKVQMENCTLEEAVLEIDRLERMNSSLLRINKERANAERDLRPKKEHTGYVMVMSKMIDRINRNTQNMFSEHPHIWKSVLQTPYDVSLPYEQLILIIGMDFNTSLNSKLGIAYSFYSYDEYHNSDIFYRNKNDERINVVYNQKYNTNYRSGYWEIEFLHLYPLLVPSDMRASKKKKPGIHKEQ